MELFIESDDERRLVLVKEIRYFPEREELSLLISDRDRIHFIEDGYSTTVATEIDETLLDMTIAILIAKHKDHRVVFPLSARDGDAIIFTRTRDTRAEVCTDPPHPDRSTTNQTT